MFVVPQQPEDRTVLNTIDYMTQISFNQRLCCKTEGTTLEMEGSH